MNEDIEILPKKCGIIVMERLQAVGNDTENADGSGAETFVPLKEGGVEEQPEQQTEQEGNLEKKKRVHPAAGRVR